MRRFHCSRTSPKYVRYEPSPASKAPDVRPLPNREVALLAFAEQTDVQEAMASRHMARDISTTRRVRESLQVNRSLVAHSAALRQKIRIMTAGPVERRLAALLLHLAERFGDEDGARASSGRRARPPGFEDPSP